MYIGQNIKYLRKSRGMTAEELATDLGKTRNAITQYELGRTTPPVEVLASLADYFGVAMDRLVNEALEETLSRPVSGAPSSGPGSEASGLWDYRNLVRKVEELEAKIMNLEKS